jgi:hypothetical protein
VDRSRAGKTTLRAYGDAHLAAQTFDETTREAVALRLRLHVYPYLGDYQLAALRPSVVQAWRGGCNSSSPRTTSV